MKTYTYMLIALLFSGVCYTTTSAKMSLQEFKVSCRKESKTYNIAPKAYIVTQSIKESTEVDFFTIPQAQKAAWDKEAKKIKRSYEAYKKNFEDKKAEIIEKIKETITKKADTIEKIKPFMKEASKRNLRSELEDYSEKATNSPESITSTEDALDKALIKDKAYNMTGSNQSKIKELKNTYKTLKKERKDLHQELVNFKPTMNEAIIKKAELDNKVFDELYSIYSQAK